MGEEIVRENKMGSMPIGRLLISMSLPMMASMLVQALYNIVDSIFVARLSEEALTAVSLAFPAQMLMIATLTGTGVGMNSFLSKTLGEKRFDTVNRIAGNGLFLAAASFSLFLVLGALFARTFYEMQTDIATIVDGGSIYLHICMCASFGIACEITCSRLLQSTGRTMLSMAVQMTGAVINIILDPIMIFGWFGFPAMGIAGAAAATVIGQIAAGALALVLNIKFNHDIKFELRNVRPDLSIIRRIYAVGIPSIVMASVGSVMVFGLNKILISFSSTAAAVLGVYFKLQSFAFMPVFGLNNGMVPVIAYNFGARRPERMKKTIKYGMMYATIIMLAAIAACMIFTRELLELFSASDTMLAIGIPALRKICVHFVFAGFCICTISTCQALGHGLFSLAISFVRQIVFLLPAAWLLARTFGLDAIWWAFLIAEIASFSICSFFMRRMLKHDINTLMQGD